MNQKILIILIIIGVLVVAAGVYCWQKDNINKLIYCAKEGETIGAEGMPSDCCAGLKAIGGWPGGYDEDCSLSPPPTGLSVCSNCGNEICEENNGENKCNCPEDCYESGENADWQAYRNEEYGYEISYPMSWRVEDEPKDFVGFFEKDLEGLESPVMLIAVEEIPLEEMMNEIKEDKYVVSIEETIINEIEGYKIRRAEEIDVSYGPIPDFVTFIISKEEWIFNIAFNLSTESDEAVEDLISTFRFLD